MSQEQYLQKNKNQTEQEFLTYKQAKILIEELGFRFYQDNNFMQPYGTALDFGEYDWNYPLPLRQQAFRWFEMEQSLFVQRVVDTSVNEILGITYTIVSWRFKPVEVVFDDPYDCFDRQKAESLCIDKLIQITREINK